LVHEVPQPVPEAPGAQAPLPPQVAWVQLATLAAMVAQAGSAVPAATALQVPAPFRLQRMQVPQLADEQHTWSTHLPLPHSAPVEHACPSARATHFFVVESQMGVDAGQSVLEQQFGSAASMQVLPQARYVGALHA
jgi:hypothetical protein